MRNAWGCRGALWGRAPAVFCQLFDAEKAVYATAYGTKWHISKTVKLFAYAFCQTFVRQKFEGIYKTVKLFYILKNGINK